MNLTRRNRNTNGPRVVLNAQHVDYKCDAQTSLIRYAGDVLRVGTTRGPRLRP
jgi:hypothetical protein